MYTTHITAAGTGQSPDRDDCPAVCTLPDWPGEAFVITYDDVTDAVRRELAGEYNAKTEHLGRTPAWVPCGMMTLGTLGQFRRDHMHPQGSYRGRLEQLNGYGRKGADFLAWERGEPATPAKQEWLDEMQADLDAGRHYWRVRILSEQLTDYELYSCQRGYAQNARFEDIRILRRGEHDIPPLLGAGDYHVINGIVVPVIYQNDGEFVGGAYIGADDDRAAAYRDELAHLFEIAEPWESWWPRHTELHDPRESRAVHDPRESRAA